MNNFFIKGQSESESIEQICGRTVCSKPIKYSRSYEKGKSFNCTEYEKGQVYYNNDFLQDFVIYDGNLYVCIRETNDVPDNSEDWKLVISSIELLNPKASIHYDGYEPRVEIVTSEDGQKKQFHFKFFNLKSESGGGSGDFVGYVPLSQSFNNDFNNDFAI